MKPSTLLALCFALLWPTVAWGATCTMPTGICLWGPITTLTCGNCQEGPAPTNQDVFVTPVGTTVYVKPDIIWDPNTDGTGWILNGDAIFNTTSWDEPISLQFSDGQDVEPGAEGNVAFYAAAGSTITITPSYVPFGLSQPQQYDAELSYDASTIWTVPPLVAPCGDGDDDVPGEVGGGGDCDIAGAATEGYTWCMPYEAAAYDPNDGGTGQTYLQESMTEIAANLDLVVRFISGQESGHIYPISVVDVDAGVDYELCIDTRQQVDGYTQDSGERPLTARASRVVTISNDIKVGDTCIDVADSTISADGETVGMCLRLIGSAGTRAYKIGRTRNNEKCDGTAVGDSLYFAEELAMRSPLDVSAQAVDGTISVVCAGKGDEFGVMAGVAFVNADATYADGEAKVVILSEDPTLDGAMFAGVGETRFEDQDRVELENVHWSGSGAASGSIVLFDGVEYASMAWASAVGGSVAGGGASIQTDADFVNCDGVGQFHASHVNHRYQGGTSFVAIGSANSGPAYIDHFKAEMASALTTNNAVIYNHLNDPAIDFFPYLKAQDTACFNCLNGQDGDHSCIAATANGATRGKIIADRTLVYGTLAGLIARGNVNPQTYMTNLLWRTSDSGIDNEYGALPPHLSGFDIRDLELPTHAYGIVQMQALDGGYLTNGIFEDIFTHSGVFLDIRDLLTTRFQKVDNVILTNITTDDTTSTILIKLDLDNDAASDPWLHNVTVHFDEGTTSNWNKIVSDDDADTGTEDYAYIGNILVDGHQGADQDQNYISIDIDDNLIGDIDINAGGIAVFNGGVASGGTGSYESVDDIGTFAVTPYLGRAPKYVDAEGGNLTLVTGSTMDELNAGAQDGAPAPGVNWTGWDWLLEQWGAEMPRKAFIAKEKLSQPGVAR